jgi:predicted permease
MSGETGLLAPLLAAVQASLSVLLVISYGVLSARLQLLNSASAKAISKICVKLFLPALLFVKIGSELHAGSASRYLVILVWALVAHLVSFLIGIFAHLVLGMPDWITVAIMFNNTTSYPLLLIQSLEETGILNQLIPGDQSMHDGIERAKSYFLVFSTVSSCLTFAVGPRLIDSEYAPDIPDHKSDDEEDEEHEAGPDEDHRVGNGEESTDQTLLLGPTSPRHRRRGSVTSVSFFPSSREPSSTPKPVHFERRPSTLIISKSRWNTLNDQARWWLLFFYDFINAPLIGAVLGAIVGLVPTLQRAFFSTTNSGGIFSAWLTASLSNIGSIFVPLPVVIAGVSLYLSAQRPRSENVQAATPWLATTIVLVVRFVLWPLASIGVIYLLASNTGVLGDDPMLWFTMMLMPTGPPAMKLITMVDVSNADEEDEHKIARLLTVSDFLS